MATSLSPPLPPQPTRPTTPTTLNSAISPSINPPKRRSIKASQRKALRQWYNHDSASKQSLASAGRWWQEQYGYKLSAATCSEILSQKYAYLDEKSISTYNAVSESNNGRS